MMVGSNGVYTAALWRVRPGNEEQFVDRWRDFATWTDENVPGAGVGQLLRAQDDSSLFISLGPWDEQQNVDAWRDRKEFKAFFADARELCAEITPHTLREVASSRPMATRPVVERRSTQPTTR